MEEFPVSDIDVALPGQTSKNRRPVRSKPNAFVSANENWFDMSPPCVGARQLRVRDFGRVPGKTISKKLSDLRG
jgi:hypothetical protein